MPADTGNSSAQQYNQQSLEGLIFSERLFRTLVEKSSDIFVLLNDEGYLSYVSPSITPLLGYTPEQFLGEHILVLFHPDDLPKLQQILQDILTIPNYVEELLMAPPLEYTQRFELTDEQGNPFSLHDLPGRRAIAGEEHPQVTIKGVHRQTKEEQWVVIQSTAIRDEHQQPLLVLTVMHNITIFKEQDQRKDEFIGMASHELKTPITTLKAYTELLLMKLENDSSPEPKMYLTRMDAQLDRINNLIQDLLDAAKVHAGKLDYAKESVDIDTLLHDVVEMVQHTSRTHTIILSGASHKHITGDSERLNQVFVNLLNNAIKYSPQAKQVDVLIAATADTVTINIRDYGIGIDFKHQQRLFERFYRVSSSKDKTFPGLGIGLYIVHEIIQRHGGTITVESSEGKGSTFCVTLPL